MTCSLCQKQVPVVYYDIAYFPNLNQGEKGTFISIKLCWNCLNQLQWEKEKFALLPQIRTCNTCSLIFLPKNSNQVKCGPCWAKVFHG